MKFLIILVINIIALGICNAGFPSYGKFYYLSYTDNHCTRDQTVTVFNSAYTCWTLYGTLSFGANSYDSDTQQLSFGIYGSSGCSGSNLLDIHLTCTGNCEVLPGDTSWYRCLYARVPNGSYTFSGFSNSNCTFPTNNTVQTYSTESSVCWSPSGFASFAPISYDNPTSVLNTYYFENSLSCSNWTGAAQESVTCDGSCHLDPNNSTYHTCTYSGSAKVVASLTILFAIMLILI